MKTINQKNSRYRMTADASGQEPRRKTLSLLKSVPAKTGLKPLAPEMERLRGRADRLDLERAENEGMYLREE